MGYLKKSLLLLLSIWIDMCLVVSYVWLSTVLICYFLSPEWQKLGLVYVSMVKKETIPGLLTNSGCYSLYKTTTNYKHVSRNYLLLIHHEGYS